MPIDEGMSDLDKKCQISSKINRDKLSQGKGSFILQDLFTNTLYLIDQEKEKVGIILNQVSE